MQIQVNFIKKKKKQKKSFECCPAMWAKKLLHTFEHRVNLAETQTTRIDGSVHRFI